MFAKYVMVNLKHIKLPNFQIIKPLIIASQQVDKTTANFKIKNYKSF